MTKTRFSIVPLLKAFADEARLRIFFALLDGPMCVCHLVELLELPFPAVSRHLTILKKAGVLRSRKNGRWNTYSINREEPPEWGEELFALLARASETDPAAKEDRAIAGEIRKAVPGHLCALLENELQDEIS